MTAPKVAVIFTQPHCNMKCTFCITEDHFSAMTFEQGVKLLDLLKAGGTKNIVLGGGEPFLWPKLLELSQEAKARGFHVQVGTNGINVPEGFETIQSIDRFVIPLEAVDAKTHDMIRLYTRTSHHAVIIDRINKLQSAGKSTTFSTIVTRKNISGVEAVGDYLRSLQEKALQSKQKPFIHAWHIYMFLPIGRGGSLHAPGLGVSDSEYESLYARLKAMTLPFRLFKRKDMYHSKEVDFFWYEGEKLCRGSENFSAASAAAGSASKTG